MTFLAVLSDVAFPKTVSLGEPGEGADYNLVKAGHGRALSVGARAAERRASIYDSGTVRT